MRIDGHQHFWSLARGDYEWITPDLPILNRDFGPDDLEPMLKAANIDGTILVQATDTVAETEYMLSLADQHDWILGVVGWVDMDSNDASAIITRLAEHPKFCGIRPMIQGIEEDQWMLRPTLDPAFKTLINLNLTFDALVLPRHLKHLLALLQRYPDLACVIDHAAKPEIRNQAFDTWAQDMRAIAKNTSAFCKISGLVTEASADWTADTLAPYVTHLIDTFGSDRLMFGSDWPVLLLAGDYSNWATVAAGLIEDMSDEGRDALFGGTAQKFYLNRH